MDSDKIAVFYLSSDGGDWAVYLQSKLQTKEYCLDTCLNDLARDTSTHVQSDKLNLFLITPDFLEKFANIGAFFDKFDKRTSLLILTGTEFPDLVRRAEQCRCTEILEWLSHEMRGDEESVRVLMVTIIGVYEGHIDRYLRSPTLVTETSDVSLYDKLPPKRSPRQVNQVVDIVQKNDRVYVMLERRPDGDIVMKFPYDKVRPKYLKQLAVYTFDCSDIDNSDFLILQDGNKLGEGSLEQIEDRVYETIPKSFADADIQTDESSVNCAECNHESNNNSSEPPVNFYLKSPAPHEPFNNKPSVPPKPHRSKLDAIRELLEDETEPERLLCQCLKIENDVKKLDAKMASMVECVETLTRLSFPAKPDADDDSTMPNTDSAWPTLLHFGAEYNLVHFCERLLSNPIMFDSCATPNKDGLLPYQIAQRRGHVDLAEMLKNFLSFVKDRKAGRYDSGFPAETPTPRLSTISQHLDADGVFIAPPEPHKSGYVGIPIGRQRRQGENSDDEEEFLNEAEIRKLSASLPTGGHAPVLSMVSDRGYSGSIEEEDENRDEDSSPLPSPHDSVFSTGSDVFCIPEERHLAEDPFPDMLDISKLPAYEAHPPSHLSKSVTDPTGLATQPDSGEPGHRRKDIISHLGIGMQSPPSPGSELLSSSPSEPKKKGLMSKLFRHNWPKQRSKSDPMYPREDFQQHLRKKETRYTKADNISRNSGTSSGSTNSTLSFDSREEEDTHSVELRQTEKSRKTYKQILKLDKKRKSLRIKHAMSDDNMAGPKLPPRRQTSEDEVF